MLAAVGLITQDDAAKIVAGLDQVAAEISSGVRPLSAALEDIHMNVEARLGKLIGGAAAGRLHTARSRNDQIATDIRLWLRAAIDRADRHMQALQAALIAQAERHTATVMPGYTHLQIAQPVFG